MIRETQSGLKLVNRMRPELTAVTFPAHGEVLHDTVAVFVHHLSQVVHGGDGVITHTVQNDAWRTEKNVWRQMWRWP